MAERVDPSKIEGIVGRERHRTEHYGRAVSREQTFYILHSQMCRDTYEDLRECSFSLALDNGIDQSLWADLPDRPVRLGVDHGLLIPLIEAQR